MRVEDHNSAEILFGHFPESQVAPQVSITRSRVIKYDFLLGFIGLLYAITSMTVVFLAFQDLSNNTTRLKVLSAIMVLLIIITWKSRILLLRYGPDLAHKNSRKLSFIFTQMVVNHGVIAASIVVVWYLLYTNQLLHLPVLLALSVIVFLIAYTRSIIDIGLITAGFGMGVIPSWFSLKEIYSRLKLFTQIKGSKAINLLVLKSLYWTSIYWVIVTKHYTVFSLILVAFVTLFYKWERINASSVMMQIRGKVQQMSPSLLPIKELTSSITIEGQPSSQNQANYPLSATEVLYGKPQPKLSLSSGLPIANINRNTRPSILTSSPSDLTPLAARSINRIADKIKSESDGNFTDLPRNVRIYCSNCGTEGVSNPQSCYVCKSFGYDGSLTY